MRRTVQCDHVPEHRRGRQVRPPRGERAHEDVVGRQAVHADAVAEQRPAAAPPRRVHGYHRDLGARKVAHQPRQQLVGETRLAGAAGAGDADDRYLVPRACQRPADRFRLPAVVVGALEHGDGARDQPVVARIEGTELVGRPAHRRDACEHVVDHPGQSHAAAVLGRVDLRHSVGLERGDLVGRNGAAAADHHAHVAVAALAQHVDHVGEIFVVAALVGGDGDGVGILVDGGAHDVGHAAVVAEVHNFRTAALQQAADHVDGGIVTVEQRGGGHEAQRPCQRLRALRQRRTPFESGIHVVTSCAAALRARLPGMFTRE